MTKSALSATILGLLVLLLPAAPAEAQNNRSWVSSTGNDGGACTREAPCRTFQGALSKTIATGFIHCVDAGVFDNFAVNKSITIDCTGTLAAIETSGTFAIRVDAAATDIVILRGLSIGGGSGQLNIGVWVASSTTLRIENCKISGFRIGNAAGIFYAPPSGLGALYVSDTVVSDNTSIGIHIVPSGTGSANVSINRVQVYNNGYGIYMNGSQSTGPAINATVQESVVNGNGYGIIGFSPAGGAGVTIVVDRTMSSFNSVSGVYAQAATASGQGSVRARIGNSVITHNVAGVSTLGAGVIRTYKTNEINDNLNDGTPIVIVDSLN